MLRTGNLFDTIGQEGIFERFPKAAVQPMTSSTLPGTSALSTRA
jgi:hypothetical protein